MIQMLLHYYSSLNTENVKVSPTFVYLNTKSKPTIVVPGFLDGTYPIDADCPPTTIYLRNPPHSSRLL